MGPRKEGPALSHSPSCALLTSVAPGLDSRLRVALNLGAQCFVPGPRVWAVPDVDTFLTEKVLG